MNRLAIYNWNMPKESLPICNIPCCHPDGTEPGSPPPPYEVDEDEWCIDSRCSDYLLLYTPTANYKYQVARLVISTFKDAKDDEADQWLRWEGTDLDTIWPDDIVAWAYLPSVKDMISVWGLGKKKEETNG
jgi:hypothetical protein